MAAIPENVDGLGVDHPLQNTVVIVVDTEKITEKETGTETTVVTVSVGTRLPKTGVATIVFVTTGVATTATGKGVTTEIETATEKGETTEIGTATVGKGVGERTGKRAAADVNGPGADLGVPAVTSTKRANVINGTGRSEKLKSNGKSKKNQKREWSDCKIEVHANMITHNQIIA